MKKVYDRINAKNPVTAVGTPVCLVYVMPRLQRKSEIIQFRANVSNLNLDGKVSVAVVHNMSAFIPPLAHRLSINRPHMRFEKRRRFWKTRGGDTATYPASEPSI